MRISTYSQERIVRFCAICENNMSDDFVKLEESKLPDIKLADIDRPIVEDPKIPK